MIAEVDRVRVDELIKQVVVVRVTIGVARAVGTVIVTAPMGF